MPHPLDDHPSYHAWLRALEGAGERVAAVAFFPPREGATAQPPEPYTGTLEHLGLLPYRHQAEALAHVAAGRHVVIATPTASGKSLVYQLPTVRALQRGGCALQLFPTKALAHDQLGKLRGLAERFGLEGVESYDGDTPRAARPAVRQRARCLVTNPDMLHYGVLPWHDRWTRFLGGLELIVVDELHSYRGVFGVHAANLLRRLLRLARHHGADPTVVAASATVGNPGEHFANLVGESAAVIAADAAPRGAREFVFWRPPELPGGDGRRRSVNSEAAALAAHLVRAGMKAIVFCNSRRGAELVYRYAAGRLGAEARRLSTYRGGYTAEDRRAVEEGFRAGDLRVLIATSALELGVDVGGVDAVVMAGYPGSLMATWQRAGRAGRAGRRSLALLIPGNDPLDEYYLQHPDLVTDGRIENATADPYNSELHPLHVDCAAAELPLGAGPGEAGGEARGFGGLVAPWLELEARPRLYPGGPPGARRWSYAGRYPHRRLRLRGGGGGRVALRDGFGETIGSTDLASALRDLHPGAVYLQRGESYLVATLDLDAGVAQLLPHLGDWYTQARSETDVALLADATPASARPDAHGALATPPPGVRTGRVRVATEVTGYVRKRLVTEAVLEERLLDLPAVAYPTQALWFSLAPVARSVPPALLPAALHALEHTLIGLLPAFVLCERADVGGVSYPRYPSTGEPTIFIYDGYPGGVGYTRAGAAVFRDWLAAAVDLLAGCSCRTGCPRCILSPKCGNGNQILDKDAARALGAALLGRFGAERVAAEA